MLLQPRECKLKIYRNYLARLVHTKRAKSFFSDLATLFCSCKTFLSWQITGWLLFFFVEEGNEKGQLIL